MNFFIEEEITINEPFEIKDEQFHHFKNVQRGNAGDDVKVFNGEGLISYGQVSALKKKSLEITVKSNERAERKEEALRLILGTPKKEYVESIFRSATQIGIPEIILVPTKFSPFKFSMHERYQKILRSAVIQSENPWMPKITVLKDFQDMAKLVGPIIVFTTEMNNKELSPEISPLHYMIGPEGGFHEEELSFLSDLQNTYFLRCDTPIMKAEIAVPYCAALVRTYFASPNKP